MQFKYKNIIVISATILLIGVGSVLALNGYFGGGATIPSDTMTRGLAGYWNFDEGQGNTAYDKSGQGNNGTLTNFSSSEVPWINGNTGQGDAISFDGTNDRVALNPITTNLSNSFSFSFRSQNNINLIIVRLHINDLNYFSRNSHSIIYLGLDNFYIYDPS